MNRFIELMNKAGLLIEAAHRARNVAIAQIWADKARALEAKARELTIAEVSQ